MYTVLFCFFSFYHVVSGNEGIVNGDKFDIVSLKNNPRDQSTNPSEPYRSEQYTNKQTELIGKSSTRTGKKNKITQTLRDRKNLPLIPILIFLSEAVKNPKNTK